MTDMVGGTLDSAFWAQGSALTFSRSGKIKVLAITGNQRNKALPDVPTFAEQGFPNFDLPGWVGAYIDAGRHRRRRSSPKVAADMRDVLNEPKVQKHLADTGFDVVASSPAEFKARYADEFRKWQQLIKIAGFQPE